MNLPNAPWFAPLRDRLRLYPQLAAHGLASLARPSVRLVATPASQDRLTQGESRLGGLPDLPVGFEWPRWSPSAPRDNSFVQWRPAGAAPLGFIAQFDLSAIPRVDHALPETGCISFTIGIGNRGDSIRSIAAALTFSIATATDPG